MVRVPKRASKRQSTKQRVKVTKKVREHHRKARRDAKKNPQWKSKKKADPGIPNSFPFKEQLLDEIQMKRDREEQRKLEERERKIAERKNKKTLAGDDQQDEEEDDDDEEGDEEMSDDAESDSEAVEAATSSRPVAAPVYSGSLDDLMADKQLSDVVICLDARDPSAWRVPLVEAAAKSKGKAVHLAITRSDLVPLEALASHLHNLGASSSASVFPVSVHSRESLDAIVKAIQGNKKFAGVAVLGLENSGRSTLATFVLNKLSGGKVFDTRHLVPVRAGVKASDEDEDEDEEEEEEGDEDEDEEMEAGSDSSFDLRTFARRTASSLQVLLRNKGQVHKIKDVLPLMWSLMPLVKQNEDLMMLYNVPAFGSYQSKSISSTDEGELRSHKEQESRKKIIHDTSEFLIGLARVQGRAKKHGIPDIYAASRIVLRDWSSGSIGYYTLSSEWSTLPKSQRESIVAEWTKKLPKNLTSVRKEWKKDFTEVQKQRKDLHPCPAIGELRLRCSGLEQKEISSVEFFSPRVRVVDEEDEEEDEEDEEDDEEMDSDEELDSDVLVPDSDDEEEDEEEDE
ncbi:unnamed protein product [Sympodiomycopsis kandeliae]